MTWTLSRKCRPGDPRRVRMTADGETAQASRTGDRLRMVVQSPVLRDLAVRHGWTLQAPVGPVATAEPLQDPEPRPAAPEPPSARTAPAAPTLAELFRLDDLARELVAGTVDEVEAALRAPRWRTDAALQAVLDAEGAGASRKGVRRAVARVRRQLQGS